jgi:simple sugar transport system permease protein
VIAIAQKSVTAPLHAYSALLNGAVGSSGNTANTIARTMPLLLTGASVAVALAAGLFNIGAEGQMAVGALAAAMTGAKLTAILPAPLLLVVALIVGMAAGAAWGFLPAYLRVKRGAHEVITAILLNYVAQNTTRYLATVPLKDPSGQVPATPPVGATLPLLLPSQPDVVLHAGIFIALAVVVLIALALRKTVWGFETRAVGEGAGAAEAAGIAVGRTRIAAMMLAGGLSGLAGSLVVLGRLPFGRFPADFYGLGYGFDGLAVALLAGGSVWGVIPSALLFGAMGTGAEQMEFDANTPKQIVAVVQAILIVAVAARLVLKRRKKAAATA